jgi:hypothetical protein
VLGLQPAAPVRRRGVADVSHGRTAELRRGRHSPAHHGQFAVGAGVARDGGGIVNIPGIGGRLPRDWLTARNSAAMAAWLVVME